MIFGYARVSTEDQNLDSQLSELKLLGCEKIFFEKKSGKDLDRFEFQKLSDQLRENDKLIVTKIDRLARSLKDLIFILDYFSKKNILLQIGDSTFNFTTPEGKLYASLFGAVAEYERELIRARTSAGLKSARSQGRIGGKPKGLSITAKKQATEAYLLYQKKLTVKQMLKATGIKSKRTLYKYIRFEVAKIAAEKNIEISEDGLHLLKVKKDHKKVIKEKKNNT